MNVGNLQILEKCRTGQTVNVVAFGSSNTQRLLAGMHWFDYLDLGFRDTFRAGCGHFINSGIGGNTTAELLERFDRDVTFFHPDLVIVTVGGNDANPARGITPEKFAANLSNLVGRIRDIGGEIVLQTYYACDLEQLPSDYAARFPVCMQAVRDCAEAQSVPLFDNYARWETLRRTRPELYRPLMFNALHVNQLGNMLIGLDWMRALSLTMKPETCRFCREGLALQALVDVLQQPESK